MFTGADYLAAAVGCVFGLLVFWRSAADHDARGFIVGFGSGATASYMLIMAYGICRDHELLIAIMKSNSVTMFGTLLYAAILNVKSISPLVFPPKPAVAQEPAASGL